MYHYATCGLDYIDGQCVTGLMYQSPKHLGPPVSLGIPPWSPLFETRCNAKSDRSFFTYTNEEYDKWCCTCLNQAGIPHEDIKKV